MAWTGHRSPNEILAIGDIVYVRVTAVEPDHKVQLALEQDSGAQAALVAIDNNTGEIRAMVGGRDFDESKFNRATQASAADRLVVQALRLRGGGGAGRNAR